MLYSNDFLGINLPIATLLIDVNGSSNLLCIQQSLNSPRCNSISTDVKKLSDYYPMFSYVNPYSNFSTKA